MTNEELIALYQQGDKQVLDILIYNNIGIVKKIAKQYYSEKTSSIDQDDLEQEGYIGLMVAVEKYNPNIENRAKFITYAVYWIKQKIGRFIEQKNTNEEMSLNTLMSNEEDSTELMDSIPDKVDYYANMDEYLYNQQLHNELDQVMNEYLTLQEREVIKLHCGWGRIDPMTFEEIADLFHMTKNQSRDIQNRSFRKIRRSAWGAKKIRETYAEKQLKAYDNVDSILDKMEFYRRNREALERDFEEYRSKY